MERIMFETIVLIGKLVIFIFESGAVQVWSSESQKLRDKLQKNLKKMENK